MLRRLDPIRIFSPSAQSAEFSAPRPPPTASPLPLPSAPRAAAGRQPRAVPVLCRAGSRRDKQGHGVTVATLGERDQGPGFRGRDHRPPALPPGPLPNRCPLYGVSRCARTPTGVCQGLRALTQRSPRSGRFTAMRVQTSEAHWRRGLAQQPIMDRAKCGGSARSSPFLY